MLITIVWWKLILSLAKLLTWPILQSFCGQDQQFSPLQWSIPQLTCMVLVAILDIAYHSLLLKTLLLLASRTPHWLVFLISFATSSSALWSFHIGDFQGSGLHPLLFCSGTHSLIGLLELQGYKNASILDSKCISRANTPPLNSKPQNTYLTASSTSPLVDLIDISNLTCPTPDCWSSLQNLLYPQVDYLSQYIHPSNFSGQEVGVVPDVTLRISISHPSACNVLTQERSSFKFLFISPFPWAYTD